MASGNSLVSFPAAAAFNVGSGDATFDEVNNQIVLDFDASSNESAIFQTIMPQRYDGGGVTVRLRLSMSSATSGDVDVDAAFELQTGQAVTADGFAAVQSTDNTTVPGTAGTEFEVTISFTDGAQMDSVGAGDLFRLKITRDAASDTAAGDMQLHAVEIRET